MANVGTEEGRRRRRKSRVTAREVAVLAGVGTMTVSRAFRNPDSVSADLRARIEEAVAALGYVPNRLAGGLASSRTGTVPVIIPSLSNNVFPDIVDGISGVLQAHNLQMLLGNTHYSLEEEEALAATFLSWSPDGIIITGSDHSERTRAMLAAAGIPVVEIIEVTDHPIDMVVGFSHFEAGRAMGEYLVERGYRRVALVAPLSPRDQRALRRLAGLRTALAAHELEPEAELLYEDRSSWRLGAEAAMRILTDWPKTDAAFFANDDLAVGAVQECSRRGVAVPGALAIAGFNGLEFGNEIRPRLTTIATPRREIGRQAAEMMVDRLGGNAVDQPRRDLGFRLVACESA
jgi:LacI family gluconate utilization system Gnt-I transcriptional repressor